MLCNKLNPDKLKLNNYNGYGTEHNDKDLKVRDHVKH